MPGCGISTCHSLLEGSNSGANGTKKEKITFFFENVDKTLFHRGIEKKTASQMFFFQHFNLFESSNASEHMFKKTSTYILLHAHDNDIKLLNFFFPTYTTGK
jgi:hypothetical protein